MDALRAVYRYVSWPFVQIAENAKGAEVPVRAVGGGYGRLAGILGATAIAALAYCAHGFRTSGASEDRIRTFKNGADLHILHSLALLGVEVSRYPKLTATLLLIGTVLFSGTCYYTAVTSDTRFVHIAPVGGTTLILAWLSFAL